MKAGYYKITEDGLKRHASYSSIRKDSVYSPLYESGERFCLDAFRENPDHILFVDDEKLVTWAYSIVSQYMSIQFARALSFGWLVEATPVEVTVARLQGRL